MFRILAFFMFPVLVIGGIIVLIIIFFFMSANGRARRGAGTSGTGRSSYSTGSSSQRYSARGGQRARTWSKSSRKGSGSSSDVVEVPILEVVDVPKDEGTKSA